jgi:hypothetical protein
MMLQSATALLLGLTLWQPQAEAPEPDDDAIVVTGSRVPLAPLLEPIEYFARHCYEPHRRTRQPAPPPEFGSDWEVLPDSARAQLRMIGPDGQAYWMRDEERGHTLVLTFDRPPRGDYVQESRCSLVVIGGTGHDRFAAGMARLFRGPGTDRHVGHPDGNPRLPGWRQLAWTAIPRRGSSAWDVEPGPRGGTGWIVVIDPVLFYDNADFVLGDLKTSEGRAPRVSVLSLSFSTRGRRRN